MYFDNLTLTGLVIFAVFFGLFVKFCLLRICGMEDEPGEVVPPVIKQEPGPFDTP